MSNQPFTVPKPNIIPGQVNRPGPGGRLPGPLAGARPGMPKPGIPGPGIKPQIPTMMGTNQPTSQKIVQEEQKEPVEKIVPEPLKTQQPVKSEPIKSELPIPGKSIPFGQKTVPNTGFKPGPTIEPPTQGIKQPVLEEDPKRKPVKQEVSGKEAGTEQTSDQLSKLSESLQAMKSLRSNFQGFNQEEPEGNEPEYEQNQEEYEGEDDDYVRVEGSEVLEERGEYGNEDQYGQDEDNQEENEQYEDEGEYRQEEEEQGYYEQEPEIQYQEEVREEEPSQRFSHEVIEEKQPQPPVTKPTTKTEIRPPVHHQLHSGALHPPQHSFQPQGGAGLKPKPVFEHPKQETLPAKSIEREETPSFSQTKTVQETHVSREPEYERVASRSEGYKTDPSLLLKIERLELELDKERKKNSLLENEQQNLVQENHSLKQKNSELNARIEILNRRATSETQNNQEIEILKNELNRSLDETRQFSENADRIISEASQYREESEALINGLVDEKNNLHHQILQMRREIDEEYVQKIEAFRQKTELFEMKIHEYENTFQIVQNQLREKSEALQKIASMNSEIQAALSSIPKTAGQTQTTQLTSGHLHHQHLLSHQQKDTIPPQSKPEIKVQPPQKTLDLPRSQPLSTPQREEPKDAPGSRKQSSSLTGPTIPNKTTPQTTPQVTPGKVAEKQFTHNIQHQEVERPPSMTSTQQTEKPPTQFSHQEIHPPSHSETISGEAFTAPPNYRIPHKAKKEDVPKKPVGGFKPMAGATLFAEEEAKEEKAPVVQEVTQSTQKLVAKPTKQTMPAASSLFEEKNEAESFFDNLGSQSQSQKPSNIQPKQRYQEETHYEQQHEENQGFGQNFSHELPPQTYQKASGSVNSSGKQNKTNLRYSENPTIPFEKEPNPLSTQEAENFFDQLGQTQSQPTIQTHNIPQTQTQTYTQPQTQTQTQPQRQERVVHQNPVQRGKNPFAEEETPQPTDFFSNSQPESFVNRPEAQRFNQTRINAGPVQTGMPKKADDVKVVSAKSSALKKTKGAIPSSMFE